MTRKEEIKQAAFNNDRESSKENQQYFIEGAEWADENPDEKMIAKYLKYKQDKFIEKACEWMQTHLQMQYDSFSAFSKDFRKAMKGE